MAKFEVVTIQPQQAAVLRAEVPMDQLPSVFDRGIPLDPRMPGDTVEVAVGFPVSGSVTATGEVVPMELPGGRVVSGVHVGPYEALETTYAELQEWARAEGLHLAVGMWETYLSDPSAEPDPATWRTQITWPVS